MTFDPAKHHRHSIRLPGYDYTAAGAYFVTMVTAARERLFGEVVDGVMRLNAWGDAAHVCWHDIPQHFAHVALDAMVVMPNHVHGVLWILDDDDIDVVGAQHAAPLPPLRVIPGSLAAIVRSYKSAVTKRINEMRQSSGERVWQRNYYEHIVRDDEALQRIRQYIHDNPARWATDSNNPGRMP